MDILSGKTALVTGASRGLGAGIAKRLAALGATVIINYSRDEKGASSVKQEIVNAGGVAIIKRFDVTDEKQVKAGIDELKDTVGFPNIIVNNATGPQPFIPLSNQRWEDHLNQLRFFVKAPLLILQACLADMKAKRYGRIINIGSEVVELGNPEFGHYVSAKGAMLGLTRSWALELGPFGITCNLVAPGWIPVERHQQVSRKDKDEYIAGVPLGFQGAPSDIANMVAFLASDEARFITGQKIAVNGGKTLL